MKKIPALALAVLSAFIFVISARANSPELELAQAHGLEDWPNVEALEFTFQVNREPPVVRHWRWDVSGNQVTQTINGSSHTIQLDAFEGEKDTKVHSQFINDKFWLLFPFSIVWSAPTVTDHGKVEIEISGQMVEVQKLTALWPNEGGYTPGDAYDLFIADDAEILGWTFRRANAPEGKFFAWKDEVQLGMLRISQSRYLEGSDEPLIELKDLRLKVAGQTNWIEPTARD
jgi:hypothetical protein